MLLFQKILRLKKWVPVGFLAKYVHHVEEEFVPLFFHFLLEIQALSGLVDFFYFCIAPKYRTPFQNF